MIPWRRTPRSVYRVYDEESYFAGEDGPAGVGEPVDPAVPPGAERERMTALSPGPRPVRLLTVGLLGIVTTIAAVVVVAQVMHHPQAAPASVAARGDRTRPGWVSAPQQSAPASEPRPGSPTQAVAGSSVLPPPAALAETPHRAAAASLQGVGAGDRSAVSPSAPPALQTSRVPYALSESTSESVWADESPTGLPPTSRSLRGGTPPPTSVSSLTSESQIDGEFGFEQ